LFAYGTVTAIQGYLEGLFSRLGPHPARALIDPKNRIAAGGYRFQTPGDTEALLGGIGRLLRQHDSLESAFDAPEGTPEDRLEAFALSLRSAAGRNTRGIRHLLPLPSAGSACKRWWMFLRWVVRPDDGVDLGLWTCLSPSQLTMPVDTHIARIARCIGLTSRRTPDRRFAREITEALKRLCAEDPTRYDFALSRLGILKTCKGPGHGELCEGCTLRGIGSFGAGKEYR